MCATASFKIKNVDVDIYMGHYGGELKVGNCVYCKNKEENNSRKLMIDKLNEFTKSQLISAFIDMIDNSDEG